MSRQWTSPLEKMLSEDDECGIPSLEELIASNNKIVTSSNNVIVHSVNPDQCIRWEFKDRPNYEIGNIDDLAEDMKRNGQIQPAVVRPLNTKIQNEKYELIIGERRWLAAKRAKIDLSVLVKNLSDKEAAILQASENQKRKDLSEYAKGISYGKLIESGIITQKELEIHLSIDKVTITRLLSFYHVPQEIWDAIGDPSKVTARTASEIRALANKGKDYISAIISLSDQIKAGLIGATKLSSEVHKIISKDSFIPSALTNVLDSKGNLLFSWTFNKTGALSIKLDKKIIKNVDIDSLTNVIKKSIEAMYSN